MIILFPGVASIEEFNMHFPNFKGFVEVTQINIDRIHSMTGELLTRTYDRVITCAKTAEDLVALQDALDARVEKADQKIVLTETQEPVEYRVDVVAALFA